MKVRSCPILPVLCTSVFVAFALLLLPTCTPTYAQSAQKNTVVGLTLFLHGIGKAGDNANPTGLGNTTPLHPQRQITLEVYNGRSEVLMIQTSTVVYDSVSGSFKGRVDLGNFPGGSYIVKVKTAKYLRKQLGEQVLLEGNTLNEIPPAYFIVGDASNDNRMNILDYNVLVRCYNPGAHRRLCTSQMELAADLNDDGKVDGIDYNLFLREIWAYKGQ